MKKLTKQYVVVYDNENKIVSKQVSNKETFVGEGRQFAEFDSLEELEQFITDNELIDDEFAE